MKKKFLTLQAKLMLGVLSIVLILLSILSVLYYLEGLGDVAMLKESYSHYHEFVKINGIVHADLYSSEKDFASLDKSTHNMVFGAALLFVLLMLFTLWIIIRRYVNKPISTILMSLKMGDVTILQRLRSKRIDDEWNVLAALVQDNINKAKELLELTQNLKHQIATKDKFFDIISHDLRTPANGIMGFTHLLLDESGDYSEKDRKDFLQNIIKCSENSNRLLERLSEWARLQTGRWNPVLEPFEINKMIENVVSFHRASAIQKKVHLVVDVKETFSIIADQNMIETALRNLVSNAIKFTQPDGYVKIHVYQQDNHVIITITDNGKGMSPKIMNALFKVGENVVSHDVAGNLGTGLGLILCKELVEKNNGHIWVESEPGKGSVFHFTVPLTS